MISFIIGTAILVAIGAAGYGLYVLYDSARED